MNQEELDENIIMFTHDSGLIEFYRISSDGSLVLGIPGGVPHPAGYAQLFQANIEYLSASGDIEKKKKANMGAKIGAHICEICGHVLPNKESLEEHYDKKHDKKYMCYYCGKSYKGEISFEAHIKKHEKYNSNNKDSNESEVNISWLDNGSNENSSASFDTKQQQQQQIVSVDDAKKGKESYCEQCNRGFVDARALMWHKRLHNNEKPYICDVCGKSFVTLNRRNQHALCAHSAPTRRCPICPALFHLRSMVNSHIRKVHLNFHKRRNRVSKHHQVHWRTEPVPIQELSISVQNELLEMRTKDLPLI
ncbi:Zinc finger protein [Eumeta japonica]|uniref:Zinc finger protein n=1 Tax=Eumeta variegata TaxID=151549 RepID=A0A4C1W9T3_EUMVA|nr:Zinc finger protein [Eumeta japonica]